MPHHEVLHTPLDIGMAHNEWTKRRRNVQRPEFLRRRRVARTRYVQELESVQRITALTNGEFRSQD